MKRSFRAAFSSLAIFLGAAHASLASYARPGLMPLEVPKSFPVGFSGFSSFRQLIDHDKPDLGTFSQRFWFNYTYWGGPGYPVVLFTPGEAAADNYGGYLTDEALPGLQAKALQAAVVMVEHRFWGTSTPFERQDTKALQYLTLNNSVMDLVNFARSVRLPFDDNFRSNAPNAPWIMTGGSYAGALAAWTEKLSPGTFWAYHASSAPVEAIYDYWQFFVPIQEGMPKNCSRDVAHIIDYIDSVLAGSDRAAKHQLKASFGLGDLEHDDDFAAAIAYPMGEWQNIQFTSGHSRFYRMCDAIAKGTKKCGDGGVKTKGRMPHSRVKKITARFASWYQNEYLPGFCAENFGYPEFSARNASGCFDTYDTKSPMYTDWSSWNKFNRPWIWMTCNEPFFYFQTGAPRDRPTIASRLLTPEYFARQCDMFFPPEKGITYGAKLGDTAQLLNNETEGWGLTSTKRLLWVNGEFDPWRSASVSSDFRPGGPLKSSPETPVFVIENGTHCQDLREANSVNPSVKAALDGSIAQMKRWVDEYWSVKEKPPQKRGIRATKEWIA